MSTRTRKDKVDKVEGWFVLCPAQWAVGPFATQAEAKDARRVELHLRNAGDDVRAFRIVKLTEVREAPEVREAHES